LIDIFSHLFCLSLRSFIPNYERGETLKDYETTKQAFNIIVLIKAINGLTYQTCQPEGQTYHAQSLHRAKKRFYSLRQGKEMTNAKFMETFQTLASVIEYCGDGVGYDPGTIKAKLASSGLALESATTKQITTMTKSGKDKYLTVVMLGASGKSR
jgi:hypothetical protein